MVELACCLFHVLPHRLLIERVDLNLRLWKVCLLGYGGRGEGRGCSHGVLRVECLGVSIVYLVYTTRRPATRPLAVHDQIRRVRYKLTAL